MHRESAALRLEVLLPLLAYAAASLFHHVHNAEFLAEYPNLPTWLSRAEVYAAWLCVTAIGVAGYLLIHWRHQLAGLIVLAVYALFGFDGLAHYAVARMSEHTLTMNLSIWAEVVTAAALLAAAAISTFRILPRDHAAAQR